MEREKYYIEYIDADTIVYSEFEKHVFDDEIYHIEAEIHLDENPKEVLFFDVYEDEDGEFTHTEKELDLTDLEKAEISKRMFDFINN